MSRALEILVVAGDPLLRKALAETLAGLADGGSVEAVTPTRVSPDRIATCTVVVLAAAASDLAGLAGTIAAATTAARPTLLVAVGLADGGRAALAGIDVPAKQVVAVPSLDIRGALARAAPQLEAALKQLRLVWRAPERVTARAAAEPAPPAAPPPRARAQERREEAPYLGPVVCIGASTGGTDALLTVLSGMARYAPPIAIVQHMPEAYVGSFAARLDQACVIDVALAEDGVRLRPGLAVVAPGGRQFRLRKDASGICTRLGESERIGGHCPSVDALMLSAATELGKRAIGVILTGMGRDGADGLLAMRQAGARTVAQDEATSVVYGMPKAAFEEGAADSVLPLDKIAGWISGLTLSLTK